MSGSVNKVILVGNVGKDPEIRSTQDGRKIANLRIATSESWKDKSSGEKREKTEWSSVVIFGPLADVAERYVKKGSKLYIEGALQTRKWQDKDGNDRYSTEVVVQGFGCAMVMLDGRGGGSGEESHGNDADAGRDHDYERQTRAASAGNGAGKGGGKGGGFDKRIEDDAIPF